MGGRLPFPNRVRVPALHQFMVLTDRADGTLWVLSHDATGEYVTLNDQGLLLNAQASPTQSRTEYWVFPADDGPVVPDPRTNPIAQKNSAKRLFVRGGRLGYEDVPEIRVSQARVLTRREVSTTIREIKVPNTWRSFSSGDPARNDDTLGYDT